MYKVLYQPELGQRISKAPKGAHICLAYDGRNDRLRDLIYSLATQPQLQLEHAEKFELAALMLNCPPSLNVQKQRLRSVVAIWRKSEEERQAQARERVWMARGSANFRADFGRMDIGLNPGWGRD